MSVRFLDDPPRRPTASNSTQTVEILHASIGTDPPIAPQQGTQTSRTLLWNPSAAQTLRIDQSVVEGILVELERANRESPLFAAFEQKRRGGAGIVGPRGQRMSIRLLKSQQLPRIDSPSSFTNTTIAIRCGPGSRVAILLGEPKHDCWCTDHHGQIVLVHRRQTHSIPLPACPSEVLFARHGELLIVGLHNGEILLISGAIGNIGEVFWSSGTSTLHNKAVTAIKAVVGDGGTGERRELLSAGLDGKVLRSRLEPNNRLELVQTMQTITLGDLPRELRKTNATDQAVGLVGMSAMVVGRQHGEGQYFIGTETGALLELDPTHLDVKMSLALAENGNGLEQIAAFSGADQGEGGGQEGAGTTNFVWRTSNGRIWQGQTIDQGARMGRVQLLPIATSQHCEFCTIAAANNLPLLLLFLSAPEGHHQRELVAWDLAAGEIVLRDGEIGEKLEAIGVDGDLVVGITAAKAAEKGEEASGQQLNFYEIAVE